MMPALSLELLVARLGHPAAAPLDKDTADDEMLVRQRDQHDLAAFEVIARRHEPQVIASLRQVLANHADIEDVLQAAFLLV
jgi:hypothetical protein